MALVEYWRTDFDTDAKTNRFFYSPAPGGLANIADVRRVTVDGVSAIEINIGSETPGVEYFSDGASDAFTKMTADARPNGTVAYCYSADSTKHGRYVRSGGSWGSRTGSTAAPLADDENHRRVTQIALMLQSWSQASDPYAPNDGSGPFLDKLGYPDFSALNASLGLPARHDISAWTMRWRLRAQGMSMGRDVKIVQHFQTRVPSMPLVGTYNGVGAPAWVNCINKATCISDYLGFGGSGIFAPNAVTYVADSGWVDVDIPLAPLWSHWLAMGGNDGTPGSDGEKMGRLPYTKALRYVCRDPADWTRNWTGNAYMLQAKFNPNPNADLPVVPQNEAVKGRLLVQSLSFLRGAI